MTTIVAYFWLWWPISWRFGESHGRPKRPGYLFAWTEEFGEATAGGEKWDRGEEGSFGNDVRRLKCQYLIILADKAGYIEHWIWHLDMFVLFSLNLSHIFGRLTWRMQENLRWRKSLEMVLTTSWIAWCTCLSMPMSWRWGEASIQVHITSALAFQCLCHPSAYNNCT